MRRSSLRSGLGFALGLTTVGCGSGGPQPLPDEAIVRGAVVDQDGNPLTDVTIVGAAGQAATDAAGNFELVAPIGDIVLKFDKDGFLHGLERVENDESAEAALRVTMVPMAPAIPLDSSAGGTVLGMRGSTLVAAPDSFRTQAGTAISGMVDVHLTPLNPSNLAELDAYPGDGLARDAAGDTIHLETFGVLEVTVVQDGEELDIVDGMGVQIQVPLPDPMPTEPPPTIPLWGFDEGAGVWTEEGVATLNTELGVYEGTIGHLSPWNCDQPLSATCIKGRAIDGKGDPIPGAYILAHGIDYSGGSSATADAKGYFAVPVRKNSRVQVTVHAPGGGKVEREVGSGAADTDIPVDVSDPRCSDIGEFVIANAGGSGGWGDSCEFGDVAGFDGEVSGHISGALTWMGEPWLGLCGGLAGGASGGSVVLFYPDNPEQTDGVDLSVTVLVEVEPGQALDGAPLTIWLSEDSTSFTSGWFSTDGDCTADLRRNDLIVPGLFRVEGVGRCNAPLEDAYGSDPPIRLDGEFSFSGAVFFGEESTDAIVECCYGGGYMPPQ